MTRQDMAQQDTARQVKDVMTPGVTSVRPDASLTEVARLMRDQAIGDVVVTRGDAVVGMITDRDITVRAVADGADPLAVPVGSVCTADPVVIGPHEPADRAVRLMRQYAVRRLPVVEDGRPVGVVSLGDLALERDPDSVLADISASAPDL